MRYVITVFMLFICVAVNAANIDSLRNVYNNRAGEDKIEAGLVLCESLLLSDAAEAVKLSKELITVAKNIDSDQYYFLAKYHLAHGLKSVGNYDESVSEINDAISYFKISKQYKRVADLYSLKGYALWKKGVYGLSYQNYLKAIEIYEEIGEANTIETLVGLGTVCFNSGQYAESIGYFDRALKIADELGDVKEEARLYNNIASVYYSQENFERSLEFVNMALDINRKNGNKHRVAVNLNNLGNIYVALKDYSKARKLYTEAYEIEKTLGNKPGMAMKLANIATVYQNSSDFDKSLEYCERALEIFESQEIKRGAAFVSNKMGKLYLQQRNFIKAKQFLDKAELYINEINDPELIVQNSYDYTTYYYELKDYKRAVDHSFIYSSYKDTVYNKDKSRTIAEIEAKYELIQKENELVVKSEEIKVLATKKRLDRLKYQALIVGMIIFIVTGLFMFFRQKQRAIQDRVIFQKDKEIAKAKTDLVEASLYNSNLEMQKLEIDIRHKNAELTNFALHIVQKNELLNELKTQLKTFKPVGDQNPNVNMINDLKMRINQHLNSTSGDAETFQLKVDKTNRDFMDKLTTRYPDLTSNEKRLCSLLRINLSSKEIASLNNTSYKAVEMARYRLRKKLMIDANDNLNEFFINF